MGNARYMCHLKSRACLFENLIDLNMLEERLMVLCSNTSRNVSLKASKLPNPCWIIPKMSCLSLSRKHLPDEYKFTKTIPRVLPLMPRSAWLLGRTDEQQSQRERESGWIPLQFDPYWPLLPYYYCLKYSIYVFIRLSIFIVNIIFQNQHYHVFK